MPGAEAWVSPRWVNALIIGAGLLVLGLFEVFSSAWYGPLAGATLIILGMVALSTVPRQRKRYGNRPFP